MSLLDVIPGIAKLNLPSPEEYRKRKVALISGMCLWAAHDGGRNANHSR